MGAFETLPKNEIIPTIVRSTTSTDGKNWKNIPNIAAPRKPPITMPGANTPPDPPDPMVNDVATIFAITRTIRIQTGKSAIL
jgi:hypothetical protein